MFIQGLQIKSLSQGLPSTIRITMSQVFTHIYKPIMACLRISHSHLIKYIKYKHKHMEISSHSCTFT